jgi:hypothetical protein
VVISGCKSGRTPHALALEQSQSTLRGVAGAVELECEVALDMAERIGSPLLKATLELETSIAL